MDNGAYISLSQQMTSFRDLAVTANNIANVNTVGYQGERLIFDDYLVRERTAEDRGKIAFARDPMSFRDTKAGTVKQTGNPLDLAIQGDGYFQINTDLGVRYTRAGNFEINNEGVLVTKSGYPVQADGGAEIAIPPNATNIEIIGNGTVRANGDNIGRIAIAEFDNQQNMQRVGETMFRTEDAPRPGANQSVLMQGHLEISNVNSINEMTRLIELQRKVGTTSKFIDSDYDLQRKVGDAYTRNVQS